jgi:hypothetical protein
MSAASDEPGVEAEREPEVEREPELAPPEPERERPGVMIPARSARSMFETMVMRVVATAGIVGIGVAIAAIMHSQHSKGWLIGLVVSLVSVILAAILWSSRRL